MQLHSYLSHIQILSYSFGEWGGDGQSESTYRILSHTLTFFGPGISRSWYSFILAAIRAEIDGSRRSGAVNVWGIHKSLKQISIIPGRVNGVYKHINIRKQ